MMDRTDEFDCDAPTKGSSPPHGEGGVSPPHNRDERGVPYRYDQPIRGTNRSPPRDTSARSQADALRSIAQEATPLSKTSETKRWMDGVPITPIPATQVTVHRAGQDTEWPRIGNLSSAASLLSAASSSSLTAPSVSAATRSKAVLLDNTSSSAPLHGPGGDVAALRFNLQALLQQAASGATPGESNDKKQRISLCSSNKSTVNAATDTAFALPLPLHSPHVSNPSSPDHFQRARSHNGSSAGLPPPSPTPRPSQSGGGSGADPSMHSAAVWPRFPPSLSLSRDAVSVDDNVRYQTPHKPPPRQASVSNASSGAVNSASREFRGKAVVRPAPSKQRSNPPRSPRMSDDRLVRAMAIGQPQGFNASLSNSKLPSGEHNRSRLREEVRQARTQQDFETQSEQLARRLDAKLELVFELMRRIMVLDAQLVVTQAVQDDIDVAGDFSQAPLHETGGEREQEVTEMDEYRDALVRQLEVGEDETVSCTLSYVELTNRHALQWMNEKQFSAALNLLKRADGLLRRNAGRVFRYLPDPVELRAALVSSTKNAAIPRWTESGGSRSGSISEEAMNGALNSGRLGSSNGLASGSNHKDQARSINVPYFSPSQEPARLKAAAAVEHNLGIYHFKMSEYASAASRFARAALLEEELHAPGIGITYFNMAQTQHELRDLPKALQYVELAEEAVERQVFAAKDAATQRRRQLAQDGAFTVADLAKDTPAAMETEAEVFLAGLSVSSVDVSRRKGTAAQSVKGHRFTDMRRSTSTGPARTTATSEPQRDAARERELLQLWVRWREGVCFMSCVKQSHAEWLDEMGQYRASSQQYEQAHSWLVSVPNRAPEEQRRAQKLKEHATKTKRKWRREEVELELYRRPVNRGHVGSDARATMSSHTCPTPTHHTSSKPQQAPQQQRRDSGRPHASPAGAHNWRGTPTQLHSTVVTSVLPPAVEVLGARGERPPPCSSPHSPPRRFSAASAAVPTNAAGPRCTRPNSANAALYSAYMPPPSPPSSSRRSSAGGEPVRGGKGATGAAPYSAHHPPLRPPTQHGRPEWNSSTHVPAPPPERRPTSRLTSGANRRWSAGTESAARRSPDCVATVISVRAMDNEFDTVVAAASATDTRRAVQPLPEEMPHQVQWPAQQQQRRERPPQRRVSGGPADSAASTAAAVSSHQESVMRSLLFDADAEEVTTPPVRSLTLQLSQDGAPLEIEMDENEAGGDDAASSAEGAEDDDEEQSSFAGVGEKNDGDEEAADNDNDDGDEVSTTSSSSEAAAALAEASHPTPRPCGDLTWCVTVLQAFLRSCVTAKHLEEAGFITEAARAAAAAVDDYSAHSNPTEAMAATRRPDASVGQNGASDHSGNAEDASQEVRRTEPEAEADGEEEEEEGKGGNARATCNSAEVAASQGAPVDDADADDIRSAHEERPDCAPPERGQESHILSQALPPRPDFRADMASNVHHREEGELADPRAAEESADASSRRNTGPVLKQHVSSVTNLADCSPLVPKDSGNASSLDRRSFLSAEALAESGNDEDEDDDDGRTNTALSGSSSSSDQRGSATSSASSVNSPIAEHEVFAAAAAALPVVEAPAEEEPTKPPSAGVPEHVEDTSKDLEDAADRHRLREVMSEKKEEVSQHDNNTEREEATPRCEDATSANAAREEEEQETSQHSSQTAAQRDEDILHGEATAMGNGASGREPRGRGDAPQTDAGLNDEHEKNFHSNPHNNAANGDKASAVDDGVASPSDNSEEDAHQELQTLPSEVKTDAEAVPGKADLAEREEETETHGQPERLSSLNNVDAAPPTTDPHQRQPRSFNRALSDDIPAAVHLPTSSSFSPCSSAEVVENKSGRSKLPNPHLSADREIPDEDGGDHLTDNNHLSSASRGHHGHDATSLVEVPPTPTVEGFEDPLRTEDSAAAQRSVEPRKKRHSFCNEEMVFRVASARNGDSGSHASRDFAHLDGKGQHDAQNGNTTGDEDAQTEEVLKTPQNVRRPAATTTPLRVHIFVFAPPRVATSATSDMTPLTVSARSENNEPSISRDATAAAPAAGSAEVATLAASPAVLPNVTFSPAVEEADGSRSLVHLSPTLTTGSLDAQLSFTESYYCEVSPEVECMGRRNGSSISTTTQISQLRASLWRSLHERGEVKVGDGLFHSLRSPLRQITGPLASAHVMVAAAGPRAGVSVASTTASAAAVAVATDPPVAIASAVEVTADAPLDSNDDKTEELLSFQQLLISNHGIDIGDADAPPLRAPARPFIKTSPAAPVKEADVLPACATAKAAGENAAHAAAPTVVTAEVAVMQKTDAAEGRKAESTQSSRSTSSSPTSGVVGEEGPEKEEAVQFPEKNDVPSLPSSKRHSSDHNGANSALVEREDRVYKLDCAEDAVAPHMRCAAILESDANTERNAFARQDEDESQHAQEAAPTPTADSAALPLPTLSPLSPGEEEKNAPNKTARSPSPTRALSLGDGNASAVDEMGTSEAERLYLREQILREESATLIQQAWRRCTAVRHPRRSYTVW
ncbi:hypothetical protein ABB37_01305 [Leptomonas pyrrhocoris]|uniref:Uncharacterized protein n=1 Tax=Leptomonas pyrrhocoris TaxID=157538 RepID=A0A0M9G8I0_LEPPY|nr:hypothetical protein ABB37_01305 [Leptomonas pyrrhocoris]KPA84833.1 hypothetical protein ABB37_01305 [Leptomonas pyrrhocoris]|eukprot:XP_015663272.1 hypothetical protein ABB37_01305 [Leptomonas pyrrhocoris]